MSSKRPYNAMNEVESGSRGRNDTLTNTGLPESSLNVYEFFESLGIFKELNSDLIVLKHALEVTIDEIDALSAPSPRLENDCKNRLEELKAIVESKMISFEQHLDQQKNVFKILSESFTSKIEGQYNIIASCRMQYEDLYYVNKESLAEQFLLYKRYEEHLESIPSLRRTEDDIRREYNSRRLLDEIQKLINQQYAHLQTLGMYENKILKQWQNSVPERHTFRTKQDKLDKIRKEHETLLERIESLVKELFKEYEELQGSNS